MKQINTEVYNFWRCNEHCVFVVAVNFKYVWRAERRNKHAVITTDIAEISRFGKEDIKYFFKGGSYSEEEMLRIIKLQVFA